MKTSGKHNTPTPQPPPPPLSSPILHLPDLPDQDKWNTGLRPGVFARELDITYLMTNIPNTKDLRINIINTLGEPNGDPDKSS